MTACALDDVTYEDEGGGTVATCTRPDCGWLRFAATETKARAYGHDHTKE